MKSKLLSILAMTVLASALVGLQGCTTTPEADVPTPPAASKETETSSTSEGESKESKESESAKTDEKPIDPEAVNKEAKEAEAKETAAKTAPAAGGSDKPKAGEEVGVIDTAKGKIVVMFRPDKAPKHVANFKMLANRKFYDGTRFHRCIPGFMIQGGDPNSKNLSQASMWGSGGNVVGGSEVNVDLEPSDLKHEEGVLSMARSGDPNSASSQFFIMHAANTGLDGQYSAFGKVVSGQEVVDKIVLTGDANNNGAVVPEMAVVVKSIRIVKWPIK
jgi:peptidyl-prolyl cis-trans isomerase B (cyclophilin B)